MENSYLYKKFWTALLCLYFIALILPGLCEESFDIPGIRKDWANHPFIDKSFLMYCSELLSLLIRPKRSVLCSTGYLKELSFKGKEILMDHKLEDCSLNCLFTEGYLEIKFCSCNFPSDDSVGMHACIQHTVLQNCDETKYCWAF